MSKELFWKTMMAGSVAGWLFAIYGLICPFESGFIRIVWLCVLLGWSILHPLELAVSLPIAKEKGVTLESAVIKTLLFGFTWWLPLKLGQIEK